MRFREKERERKEKGVPELQFLLLDESVNQPHLRARTL